MADNVSTPITNPLQNNNAIIAIVSYLSGVIAAKYPIFDLATWNYIFMSALGILAVVTPYVFNRKSAVVTTAANMPEVKTIEINKSAPNAASLVNNAPDNVVVK